MSTRWVRRTAVASVLLVGLVAAVVSFAHIRDLADRSGEDWRAWLIPLSVDGMLVAATLAIVDRRRVRQPAGWVPWLGLGLGVAASLAGNVAAARPDVVSQVVAAWPPIALAVSIETLVVILRRVGGLDELPEGPDTGRDWWADAPYTEETRPEVPAIADTDGDGGLPVGNTEPGRTVERAVEPDRVGELIEAGAGRRRLARELGVSEHQARRLLAARDGREG